MEPSSRFLGADPNMGVAVLKRSMSISKTYNRLAKSRTMPLGRVIDEDEDDDEVKPVELYYSTAANPGMADLIPIILDPTEDD